MPATVQKIKAFLDCGRIAMVGVSRRDKDFTRQLFRAFLARGYDMVPVNPQVSEIEGRACFPRLQDIPGGVEAALLVTRPHVTVEVVRDCAESGIHRVWMHRGAGVGASSPEAIDFCAAHGIDVISNLCPFAFLERPGWIHRLHGYFMKRDPKRVTPEPLKTA